MFSLLDSERDPGDIRFTPAWYVALALMLSGGFVMLFVSLRAGFPIVMFGNLANLFALHRNAQNRAKPCSLGLAEKK